MTIEAKVVADSINEEGVRLITMELSYPRIIHSEFMTHRVFSRGASSSRAIPVRKVLAAVWNGQATPVHWGANQPGMQARAELWGWRRAFVEWAWKWTGRATCVVVWAMSKAGLHKQVANRLLEPWSHIRVIVTSTEWDNFFALRDHPDAQPEFQVLAHKMRKAQEWSTPHKLANGEWHLPYVDCLERMALGKEGAIKVSVARCCRVSTLNHEGKRSSFAEDRDRYYSLIDANPPHSSPTEHQAMALPSTKFFYNLRGWRSHRWELDHEIAVS